MNMSYDMAKLQQKLARISEDKPNEETNRYLEKNQVAEEELKRIAQARIRRRKCCGQQ